MIEQNSSNWWQFQALSRRNDSRTWKKYLYDYLLRYVYHTVKNNWTAQWNKCDLFDLKSSQDILGPRSQNEANKIDGYLLHTCWLLVLLFSKMILNKTACILSYVHIRGKSLLESWVHPRLTATFNLCLIYFKIT